MYPDYDERFYQVLTINEMDFYKGDNSKISKTECNKIIGDLKERNIIDNNDIITYIEENYSMMYGLTRYRVEISKQNWDFIN